MEYPRIGEALVRGERHRLSAAEPEVIIGDLNGPVGVAFATLLGGQVEGHTRGIVANWLSHLAQSACARIRAYLLS